MSARARPAGAVASPGDTGAVGLACAVAAPLSSRLVATAFERVYRPLWNESTVRESEQLFVTELIRDADPSDWRQSDVLLRGLSLGRGHIS